MTISRILPALFWLLAAPSVLAQGTDIRLGGISADPDAPVEIVAGSLAVDQESGRAEFTGGVVIGQGDLRIAAARVLVRYDEASDAIAELEATGGVTFVTPTEAAEAQRATYDLNAETLVMTGSVLLTQGASAISADVMRVDLTDGSARMEGNVRTIFQQSDP